MSFAGVILLFGLTAIVTDWDDVPESLMLTAFVFLLPAMLSVLLFSDAPRFDAAAFWLAYIAGIGAAKVKHAMR